ncbi:MAG: alkaline phosphatase family protein [Candidatus Rokubacteria bacterium]|nr:alkaline phosphatase family protein [Candidatus Rokubacteria bacterium]
MKVAVIGLDCAAPRLVFDDFRHHLPNLSRLMAHGVWGPLESANPPITVPAWACMMSGCDPGQLGIYGFRNRKNYSYDEYTIATAAAISRPRVWDMLSQAGKQVILLGVPQTYPIKPVNGYVVTDFLTPSTQSQYTQPSQLKPEVERVSGGYVFDVENFRTDDKAALVRRVYDKTRKHFAVARHLLSTKPWDFFMMVEMGVDRIHHGFWNYMDKAHIKYQPESPFEHVIRDYYRYVDGEVGELLALLPEDTAVFVVSDHGGKKLDGAICFNEWLIREGYLVLKEYPSKQTPIANVTIDWARTTAWGEGGYYGRLFMNVQGREPQGVIPPAQYEAVRSELVTKIAAIRDPNGRPLNSKAFRPEEVYREVRGVPPDLLVYFGDLDWRSVGAVGIGSIYTFENDTGPDGANHDWQGIFIYRPAGARGPGAGPRTGLRLYDVGPTILTLFGLRAPADIVGRSIPLP